MKIIFGHCSKHENTFLAEKIANYGVLVFSLFPRLSLAVIMLCPRSTLCIYTYKRELDIQKQLNRSVDNKGCFWSVECNRMKQMLSSYCHIIRAFETMASQATKQL